MNEHRWYASHNTLYTAGLILAFLLVVTSVGNRSEESEVIFVPAAPTIEYKIGAATLPSLPSLEEDVMDLTLTAPEGYLRAGAYSSVPPAPAFTAELPAPELGEVSSLAERIESPALMPMAYPKPGRR